MCRNCKGPDAVSSGYELCIWRQANGSASIGTYPANWSAGAEACTRGHEAAAGNQKEGESAVRQVQR
jgi:hypothetical protein